MVFGRDKGEMMDNFVIRATNEKMSIALNTEVVSPKDKTQTKKVKTVLFKMFLDQGFEASEISIKDEWK